MEPMSYVKAMKDFFGFKPGQSLMEFAAELKALTPADKLEFIEGLKQNGYIIIEQ
jgi:hypothetical protein